MQRMYWFRMSLQLNKAAESNCEVDWQGILIVHARPLVLQAIEANTSDTSSEKCWKLVVSNAYIDALIRDQCGQHLNLYTVALFNDIFLQQRFPQ